MPSSGIFRSISNFNVGHSCSVSPSGLGLLKEEEESVFYSFMLRSDSSPDFPREKKRRTIVKRERK